MAKKEKETDKEPSERTKKELLEVKESIRAGIEKVVSEGAVKLEKALQDGERRDCCSGDGDGELLPGVRRSIKLVTSHHIVDALCKAAESLRDQEIGYVIGVFHSLDKAFVDSLAESERRRGKAEK